MILNFWRSNGTDAAQPPAQDGTESPGQSTWKLEGVRLVLSENAPGPPGAGPDLREGSRGIVHEPFIPIDFLAGAGAGNTPANTAPADKEYDLALLDLVKDDEVKQDLLIGIMEKRHGLLLEHQRAELMKKTVEAVDEVNHHLVTWRKLAQFVVPPLLAGTVITTLVLMFRLLPLVSADKITGAELALLLFVLALVAVSPVTLLLIGRPLKGLDEWNPSKTAAEKPAAGDGSTGAGTPSTGVGAATA